MARYANSISGYNLSGKTIPAYTPVAIQGRVDKAGISDDPCFAITTEGLESAHFIGITAWEIPFTMAGKVFVSGVSPALLDEIFDSGDPIAPTADGKWAYSESGQVRVLFPGGKDQPGTVFLGSCRHKDTGYRGMFSVVDASEGGELKVRVNGGDTDLGLVGDRYITLSEEKPLINIDLLAEYHDKRYILTLTTDPSKDIKSDCYALWRIAFVEIRKHKDGVSYPEIVQQWNNGKIYFGSRYWI